MEKLFYVEREDRLAMKREFGGPDILEDVVQKALKEMKRDKAERSDGVAAEMLEAAGEFGIRRVTKLANRIHDTGEITKKMWEIVLITNLKKPGAVDCES